MATLSRLFIHPVKSMAGMSVSHALTDISGLALDRIFMITETDGAFITARQFAQMVRFTPSLLPDGLHLTAPDGSQARIHFAGFAPQGQTTEVWGNHFTARVAGGEINRWLSGFFPRPVQLRWLGPTLTRRVKNHPSTPLSFADGFPCLLTTEASLHDLQNRCPARMVMAQFRPNLVVTDTRPWEEDNWKVIRIGDVIFDVVKPCSRCIMITINPDDGHPHPRGEPLTTLQKFRQDPDNGDIDFGHNLIPRTSGLLRSGDSVEILATRPGKIYPDHQASKTLAAPKQPDATFDIHWQGQAFRGNNQQTLLEQLQQQGIDIPCSCRAGICGCCRIRLIEGEVSALKKAAIAANGTILSCSCIPQTPLRLEP